MKPLTTTATTTTPPPPTNPTQMHLCRLIRFVWSLFFFSPPRLLRETFSLSAPALLLPLCLPFLSSCLTLFLFVSPPLFARPLQLGIQVSGSTDHQLMYCEAKMAARPYQTVKQQWFRSLQETGLGTWVKKPPEQEQFLLSV